MTEDQRGESGIPEEESALSRIGISIIHRLNRACRMSKIYELNNLIYLHQIDLLHHHVQRGLEGRDDLTLSLRDTSLLINGVKIRFGFSNYHLFKFIKVEFEAREIGEMVCARGVTKQDLSIFVQKLAQKPSPQQDPHEDFLSRLRAGGVERIVIQRIPPFEHGKDRDKAAKKVYFLGITHLKEMFERQEQKHVSLITTKRLMQSIFNHITDNESFLFGLTNIKNFDEYTLNHSVNVCILSIALGKKLGLDRKELVDLGLSAFFHDFGKLDIPRDILLKPDKLSSEERLIIQHHPQYGAEKLIQMQEFSYLPLSALNVAMEHHTREDEKGYPHYTRKKNIHFFSKIVKIVDFFDAVTTKRPYRKRDFSREDAIKMLRERSGIEFDPLILKVFINMIGELPVGTPVLMDSGEIGIVFEINPDPDYPLRPRVKLITDKDGRRIDGDVVDLMEIDRESNTYAHSIVKPLDPDKYHIPVADYFVAEAT